MEKLNRNLIEKDSSSTLLRRTSTRSDSRLFTKLEKQVISWTKMITEVAAPDHLASLTSFFAICRFQLFNTANERKMKATSSQTQCLFLKDCSVTLANENS